MWPHGWGWNWPMAVVMGVFWLLVIVGIIYAIGALSRVGGRWSGPPGESPLDILDRRYARGEVTREQYQQMREDLTRRGGGEAPPGS
jgi:putative membrane protein